MWHFLILSHPLHFDFVITVLCKLSHIPFKIDSSFMQTARKYIKECEDYSRI